MKIVTLKPEQFDKFSKKQKYRNYHQTVEYANLMIKFGFSAHFLGFVNEYNKVFGATLILYKEVFMSNKIAYAPRGFLLDYDDPNMLLELADKLKKLLGKQGFMLLKIDPYITQTIKDTEGHNININNQANIYIENLKAAGFEHKPQTFDFEDEKPRFESLILLNKSPNDIFNNFTKRTRHKIRKAVNSGIEIIKSPDNDITPIYNFIKQKNMKPITYYKRMVSSFKNNLDVYYAKLNTEQYVLNSKALYEREMEKNDKLATDVQNSIDKGKNNTKELNKKMESDKLLNTYKNNLVEATELLKKHPEGLIIAGAINLNYDNASFLVIDGFDKNYTNLNATYFLKWQMIIDYKSKHYKYYNINGVSGKFEVKHQFSNLNEMKFGFNPIITEYVGEFDIILNNFSYNIYKGINKQK